MSSMPRKKNVVQFVWGIALVLAGIGVFFRIPYVISRVEGIEQFADISLFTRLAFYLLGVFLICGGAKKVFEYTHKPKS